MKRFKHIIDEVKALEKFQVYTDLIKFLNVEFGLLADIEIFMNYIDIHTSKLRDNNTDTTDINEDAVSKAIKAFYNKQNYNKKAEAVWVTEYGYVIVLETEADIFEEKLKQENALYYYYYADTLNQDDTHTNNIMIKGLKKELKEQKESVDDIMPSDDVEDAPADDETKDKAQVTQDTSNIVLDQNYVWFFSVLDDEEQPIEEDIMELEEAIDTLIEWEGTIIIALPYKDPNPEDDTADLIFADDTGPVIIYDGR